ncbi:MAG TPA: MarP family serine protease [Actinomycetota bacterium]|nr:MarP family serine protease [Actinomycetota bacterium]
MNPLDWAIVGLVVLAGVNGFRRGALLQLASYLGLFLGLVAGALVAPRVAPRVDSPLAQAVAALSSLLLLAALGDGLGWVLGSRMWHLARRSALRAVDALAGAAVSIVALLLAVWFVGFNLANGPIPPLARLIRGSAVVQALDGALPRPPSLIAGARQFLDRFGFPEVFADVPPPPAGPVRGPSRKVVARAAAAADQSTVKVVGEACGATHEGSGFVVAPRYVLTNAHVVAGMRDPLVQLQGDPRPHEAAVVLFDPQTDVAVLRVEGVESPPLPLDLDELGRGAAGAVLGYPGGGGLRFEAAAVRRQIEAVGRDIYGRSIVRRDLYELQTQVRPGNSGGPFVLPDGRVAGVVIAASTGDPDVGYALTASEVAPFVERGVGRTREVSTGPCLR